MSLSPVPAQLNTTRSLDINSSLDPTNRLRNRGPLEVDMDVSVGFASDPFDLTKSLQRQEKKQIISEKNRKR